MSAQQKAALDAFMAAFLEVEEFIRTTQKTLGCSYQKASRIAEAQFRDYNEWH